MSNWLVSNHDALEAVGGLSIFLSLVTVFLGGGFAIFRFSHDSRQSYIQSARSIYYEYCRSSIDSPEYFLNYWETPNLLEIDRQRYIRFICFMINGIEDIISVEPNPAWHIALREDFRPHVSFLNSQDFLKLRPYFFPETCKMIDVIIDEEVRKANA